MRQEINPSGVGVQNAQWGISRGSRGVQEEDQRAGAPLLWRLRAGVVQPQEKRLQAEFIAAFQYLEEACKKDGDKSFRLPVVIGKGVMILNRRRVDQTYERRFYNECGEALAQVVAQRGGGITLVIQGQAGQGWAWSAMGCSWHISHHRHHPHVHLYSLILLFLNL